MIKSSELNIYLQEQLYASLSLSLPQVSRFWRPFELGVDPLESGVDPFVSIAV